MVDINELLIEVRAVNERTLGSPYRIPKSCPDEEQRASTLLAVRIQSKGAVQHVAVQAEPKLHATFLHVIPALLANHCAPPVDLTEVEIDAEALRDW
ncbi:MAG TPA: hypothetical protein VF283_05595 [Bryobacteraceae bacterium]